MNCLVQNILNLTHKPAEKFPGAISLKPVSMSQPVHHDDGGDSSDSDAPTANEKQSIFSRTCGCQNQ